MSKEKEVKAKKTEAAPAASDSAAELRKAKLAKLKSFETAMEKKYGPELLQNGSTKKEIPVDVISTGSVSLDVALGVGGLPKGRVVEIYGPEASGKTTLTLQVIAEAQAKGGVCGFIDAEQALDVSYAKLLGVKFDETLQVASPTSGENALQIAREMADSGAFDVIVIDSVAALVPQKELEGEQEDNNMGLQARMMSKALRVLTPSVAKNNVLMIFINQIREKIGVMYGSPETTTGGNSLKFYASVRFRVRKQGGKDGEISRKIDGVDRQGYKMIVKTVKNKLNSPQEDVELPIIYGLGVDKAFDIFSAALALDVIEIQGRTHSFNGEPFATSSAAALDAVVNDKELLKKIEKAVRSKMK